MHAQALLLSTLVAAVSAQNYAQYAADIESFAEGLATQPGVLQAIQALESAAPAIYSEVLANPTGLLGGAATAGAGYVPAYYSLLPPSAAAVFSSIDADVLSIYSKDIGGVPGAVPGATVSGATSTSGSGSAAGVTSSPTMTMAGSSTPAASSATAAAASTSTAAAAPNGASNAMKVAGVAIGAVGVAVALL